MQRTIKHLSLHRIADTELRVVSDVERGVSEVLQAEETVIRQYIASGPWPHRQVSLFVLQNLDPLIRQLPSAKDVLDSRLALEQLGLSSGVDSLARRPVVTIYDLADLGQCHVFVNEESMRRARYWADPTATRGLLAHEHAHALTEAPLTCATRQLRLGLECRDLSGVQWELAPSAPQSNDSRRGRVQGILLGLAKRLCLYGPREVLANEQTIVRGFGEELTQLDGGNLAAVASSVSGRDALCSQVRAEVARGEFSAQVGAAIILVGDMESCLDLALESSAMYRAGREAVARDWEQQLNEHVFRYADVRIPSVYRELSVAYQALRSDWSIDDVSSWVQGALAILARACSEVGLLLDFALTREGDG